MNVIDAHQHFWCLGQGRYIWLTDDYGPINRSFDESDLVPLLKPTDVARTVLVQAENTYADTVDMFAACDRWPVASAVVGWVPLDQPEEAASALSRFTEDPRFVGVRHLIHEEPDEDWLIRPEVLDGLRRVSAAGLTFDVVAVTSRHLEHVSTIANLVPQLTLVIDHLGAPPVANGGWEPWSSRIAAAASYPNVVAKISGLGTLAGRSEWNAEDLRPYVEYVRALFGAKRLMYGGDWPVNELAGGYLKVWKETAACVGTWSSAEQEDLFINTARRIYKVR
ncbi:amidohydrolase family protein [Phytoactinopolyspora endophytica]|uniref:amidohydrolase family protein n=1 Tax=Phytoactinopolyspora endophytica TaxID=1642495 RepID=UPI00101CCC5A|nr:amidohydrolase family protein [Phytoactinopolyspora endophytica]